ncbi:hypothetical protein [Nocardioides alcanivorans]|uniref:hypothetical protein n=1 Tax=Nocardioides alcanivorans TaxID=2897352 RepID=UPI001F176D91|nr:hypothetical protein [Nocardioides alcanivorans]
MKVYECRSLPLWVRVSLYAVEHSGRRLDFGELRRALDPTATPADISRAIRRGIAAELLAHDSTAGCLHSLVVLA